MRISIAFKIFIIVLVLLLLMTVVAAVSTHQARKVGLLLDGTAEGYVPAYAALARADIRSLEQALALRRLVIAGTAGSDTKALEFHRSTFATKGTEAADELAAARQLIAAEIASASPFADAIALARLDTRLELLQESRGHYEREVKSLLSAISGNDSAKVADALDRVDGLRNDLNVRLEAARTEMRQLLVDAARRTREEQQRVVQVSIAVTVLAGLLGLGLAAAMTLALLRPVKRLLAGTQAVEAGALDIEIPVTSSDEIGRLTTAFNHMVGELRTKARIRDTFGKYVDPRIVEGLIERPALTAIEGERRIMTVFFCDLKGFSALGEKLTPKNLVTATNRYLTVMSEPVRARGGILDKYIGDSIMAYWGPPFSDPNEQATLACLAALDMVERVAPFLAELPELTGIRRGLPEIGMRIGIATGAVLVGNIGSESMMSYTVLGGSVNLASRIEGANKHYGTAVLVGQTTAAMAEDTIETREIDTIIAVGAQEPERIFEVMGHKGKLDGRATQLRASYLQGLEAYRRRDWDAARESLNAALEAAPGDGPAQALLAHVDWWLGHPPPADWDGAWRLTEK